MTTDTEPTRRPGGRTARNTTASFDALLAEHVDHGMPALSIETVATRAGVHRSTLYRRWGGVDQLLAAALTEHPRTDWVPVRHGDLIKDLTGIGQAILDSFDDPAIGPIIAQLYCRRLILGRQVSADELVVIITRALAS